MRNLKTNEQGNVLFLILIAVALFAALSYAVTQSTRTGGGDAGRETNTLNTAALIQYPSGIRTSMTRMSVSGVGFSEYEFNKPGDFDDLTNDRFGVFHPDGGGALYQEADNEVLSSGTGEWFFNANFYVSDLGDGTENEIIAFLPGVSNTICQSINDEQAIDNTGCNTTNGIPDLLAGSVTADDVDTNPMEDGYSVPTPTHLEGDGCTAFAGKASGCFYEAKGGGRNVFFTVLLEQ